MDAISGNVDHDIDLWPHISVFVCVWSISPVL